MSEKVETKPCGCTITTMEDGKQIYAPCMACGLMETAQALMRAANALGAVATTVQNEQKQ